MEVEADPPRLDEALLGWVNSFDLAAPVQSWNDLGDGRILWKILRDIDPEYFTGSLPEPDEGAKENWIPKWQNLKHINRMVTTYLHDECGSLLEVTKHMSPDLKAIAINGSAEQSVKLLKTVLLAAMTSSKSNERMTRMVIQLGPTCSKSIAAAIAQMQELDGRLAAIKARHGSSSEIDVPVEPDHQPTPQAVSSERDPELEREEKLIQAYTLINQLEREQAEAFVEIEEIRKENAALQDELTGSKYELEHSGRKSVDNQALEQLKIQSDKDRDYISELESDLANSKAVIENQERQLERHKPDYETKQKLLDDLQLLKAERDELLKKSKVNENLRKKLQALQDQEKANQELRQDLQAAREQIQVLEPFRERCASLQKANAESVETITNGEQEIFDQKTARRRVEHDLKITIQKWEAAKDMQLRDRETINELEEKIREIESGRRASVEALGNLGDELDSEDEADEISKANGANVDDGDLTLLKQKLDAFQLRNAKLEEQYLDMFQDKLGLETAMNDLENTEGARGSHPFLEQRKKLHTTQHALDELKSVYFRTDRDLAEMKQRLLALESQSSERKAQYLDEANEFEALTASYATLQQHAESLKADLEEKTSLLRHALLNCKALQMEADDVRRSNEYKIILAQLEAIKADVVDQEIIPKTAAALTEKVEEGRRMIKTATKRAEDQTALISELQQKFDQAAKHSAPANENTSHQRALQNLRKENDLMTTAWYTLTTRLQSNSISLQRRPETPRTLIGRQRMAVGAAAVVSLLLALLWHLLFHLGWDVH
ncbi:hypothetical protein B0A49_03378 [Cryomyces minteri]|uniref:HOOK N-terminal domain-containing protein n=1 Tax=Cryomyces minteri TaxID=331657 RepID=A0A4U0WUR2_9PEZI|nr:hypothetical protein B0A49_03378 [Cryomyces minteri]